MVKNSNLHLPNYQVIDLDNPLEHPVLRTVAHPLRFPLTQEDLRDVAIIEAKYDHEKNMAGLAAPQIGIAKPIIIFAVNDDPDLKKWRPDLTQTIPKTIWVNPSYEGIGDDKHEDYEACFSVLGVAGPVKRFKTVRYAAYDLQGNIVEGVAEGFLARVIQHEVDHVRGKLFLDYVPKDQILNIEAYREKRQQRILKE